MITGLEHNYRGLIPPPALSGQDAQSTYLNDRTINFVYKLSRL